MATRTGDEHLLGFCEEWLGGRLSLLALAHEELVWFVEQQQLAVKSGMAQALTPA